MTNIYFTLQGRTNFKWEFQIGTMVFIGTSLLKQRTVLVSTNISSGVGIEAAKEEKRRSGEA